MIRLVFLLLLALAGCTTAVPGELTKRLQVLRWTGKATVHAGGRTVEIGVSTRVDPFRSARSDTWLLAQGPAATRSLIVEPDRGWIERGGQRTPMSEPMLRHERQQYAIYGLMQLALRQGPSRGAGPLTLSHPDAPTTIFTFAPDGRLATAANRVGDPEGGGSIDQLFRFSGKLGSGGLRWPKQIDIFHAGKPYFTLKLESFEALPPG